MKINSSLTGTTIKEYKTKINWRDLKNYAAAINDNNPFYFDDEREGGIVGHPMFTVASTWPIAGDLPDYVDSEEFSREIQSTQVHYSEHIIFHDLIKPDDTLTINGEVCSVVPHRAGTHAIIKFSAVNQDNKKIFTEYSGVMLRGVTCEGPGTGMENIPTVPVFKNKNNEIIWREKKFIDPMAPYIYDGCTNIVFPIHTSVQFAHFVGLPDIILQGTATLAMAVKELINKECRKNPSNLKEISCRFSGFVVPDSDITIQLTGKNRVDNNEQLFFNVLNDKGEKAINKGFALIEI